MTQVPQELQGAAPVAGRTGPNLAALVGVLVAVLALGALLGSVLTRQPAATVATEGSVDAGFARDMQVHHAQAVELSVLVRDRSADDELRIVALDILLTQQNQIGQMAGWLSTWGLPAANPDEPMAWMTSHGHDGMEGMAGSGEPDATGFAAMPGWVSSQDMARLTAADGVDAERVFLELMIAHHEGGVLMAQDAAQRAGQAPVRSLASNIVTAQTREATTLQDLLDARGGPLP